MKIRCLLWLMFLTALIVPQSAIGQTIIHIGVTFEAVNPNDVDSEGKLTFIAGDPRVENVTTAVLVTQEGFESEIAVFWSQHDTSPILYWEYTASEELKEIYFLSSNEVELEFSTVFPWMTNRARNGVIRTKWWQWLPQIFGKNVTN